MKTTDDNAKWGVPDLSECVSDKMAELTQQVTTTTTFFFSQQHTLIVRINFASSKS